ncbi:MAG: amino acid permease [Kovacikia sp.]
MSLGGGSPHVSEEQLESAQEEKLIEEDVKTLHSLGYAQELLRRMSGFSNFAVSFSIICILSGGINSFHLGFSSVGGASIGLGWPFSCMLSLLVAMAMGQIASAFPTAGGLYHWASILGGKGWGWLTAWFNLAGLITVLSAINVGTYLFLVSALGPIVGFAPSDDSALLWQFIGVSIITFSHALFNHLGIRLTTKLIDFSGYLIFAVSTLLTIVLLVFAAGHGLDFSRLSTFTNYSGDSGGGVWPQTSNLFLLFLLGLMLPAYTITGFDASAHTSEETIGAAHRVPQGIVRSVLWSGVFGWLMLAAVVLAFPNMNAAAAQGAGAFFSVMDLLPVPIKLLLYIGIGIAQYLCGLATVTSASRMTFAFARDGGLPASGSLRSISHKYRTPVIAIWAVSILAVLFTVYTPVYSTITAVCVIFLYISYIIPTALGLFAYGRTWTRMGPWTIGRWFQPVAGLCIVICALLIFIGVQPPNDKALGVTIGALVATAVVWFAYERRRFQGPPQGVMIQQRQAAIEQAERAVGEID